jgi:ABC-type transport system involved in cytochrome c biogenesis permease component
MRFLPIVERELRVTARKAGTYWLRTFAALVVIVVSLALIFAAQSSSTVAQLAQILFATVSFLAFAYCFLAGSFLTADCLSEEKREGTLGLLFLTDLKGYDVVLGKLAASSVHAVYALLSILPILALPLLLGGVTAGEFWRMILVLLVTLFFSLTTGVFISSLSRGTRQAMCGVGLILVLVTLVLPIFHELLAFTFQIRSLPVLLWPNPFYAYTKAFDHSYRFGIGPREFWTSTSFLLGMGLTLLISASLILPRAWQEKKQVLVRDKRAEKLQAVRFGSDRRRKALRTRLLAVNPFYWLAGRDQLPKIVGWVLFGSMITLWLCLFVGVFIAPVPTNQEAFSGVVFIAFGLNLIFKYMVAMEASRRLNEDLQSGALELLLVSPLPEQQIVSGQRRALLRHFRFTFAALVAVNVAPFWLINGPNPLKIRDDGMLSMMFLGSAVMLIMDFFALGWVGMWRALRAKKHHRAVLSTLAQVLLPPWIALFLFWMILVNSRNVSSRRVASWLLIWFILGGINDLVVALWARSKLRKQFRRCAASSDGTVERLSAVVEPAKLEPASA